MLPRYYANAGTIPEFGEKRENEERRNGGCAVIFNPETRLFAVGWREVQGLYWLFSGGVEAGEDIEQGVLREVREESGLYDFAHVEKVAEAEAHYRNSAKQVNRVAHATCFLVILKTANLVPTQLEAHEQFTLSWVTPAEIRANWEANGEDGLGHWLYFLEKATERLAVLSYDATPPRDILGL